MARAKKQNGHRINGASKALANRHALARVGDPLVLPDGRIIEPSLAVPEVDGTLPRMKPSQFKATKRRSMDDLPLDPQLMNGLACVLMYTLLGVGNREIADTLKIYIHDVQRIKKNPAYAETFDMLRDEFINVNSDMLHARIAAYGHAALTTVAHVALKGKHEGNKLKAGIDLLDRGGVTKKEAAKGGNMSDALRIVVTDGAGAKTEVSVGGAAIVP